MIQVRVLIKVMTVSTISVKFSSVNLNTSMESVMYGAVVTVNTLFLFYWIYNLTQSIRDLLRDQFKQIYHKYFLCNK
jgi:hypothetical protein